MNSLFVSLVETPLVRFCARIVNGLAHFNKPVPVDIGGLTIYAQTLDRLAALYLLKYQANESFEARLFQSTIRPGMRIVDLGANLGYYTLLAARCAGAEGRVYAFEPDQENFALLQRAVEKNGLTNVQAARQAVSNVSGSGTLYFCPEHRGDHRIYDSSDGRNGVAIETVRLDDVVEKGVPIDVIKMDIQGAEGRVLQGMERILRENPALILMTEFWPYGLAQSGDSAAAFLDRVQRHGFRLGLIDDSAATLQEVTRENLLGCFAAKAYGNLFLTRGAFPQLN